MLGAGTSRNQLARTLHTAYAEGLISDQTLSVRLEKVLRARLIEPERLVGDLYLRAPRRRVRGLLSSTMSTVIERLDKVFGDRDQPPTTLLGLNWSGEEQQLVIGRSSRCDVVLADLSVSRQHARLISRDGKWVVQDLSSTNGTFLNGQRVGRSELRPGDDLYVGQAGLRVD